MKTKYKMFSSKSALRLGKSAHFNQLVDVNNHYFIAALNCDSLAEPNTHVNFVDLALPGMLPVLNENCLDLAIKASLALGGTIPGFIKWDRKHYNYADLPQAY